MRKLRSMHQLYKVLYNHYKKLESSQGGLFHYICNAIKQLYKMGELSEGEYNRLLNHFQRQRPTKDNHPQFMTELYNPVGISWWEWRSWENIDGNNHEGIEIRREFIKHMVSHTRPERWYDKLMPKHLWPFY